MFTILDPRAPMAAIETIPLRMPRLDTLSGKTVYVYKREPSGQYLMEGVVRELQAAYPDTEVILWNPAREGALIGRAGLNPRVNQKADAIIVGNGM